MPPPDAQVAADLDQTRTADGVIPVVDSHAETRDRQPDAVLRGEASTARTDATPTPVQFTLPLRYTLVRSLGRGGMGEVLHAFDAELQRHVAIKFMRATASASAVARRRFQDESRILAQLQHPNVVDVFERGEIDGEPYFVMAYLGGHSLANRAGEFRASAGRAVGVMVAVAGGVHHAHEHGVFHRDLKASNVMFDAGRPVVVDFGCARWEDAEQSTQGFALLGTVSHMPPEVYEHGSKGHDARADLWSLGVMLYHLLAGKLPFDFDILSPEGRKRLQTEDPPPVRSHPGCAPGVDDRLEGIVRRALSKDPNERHQTVAEFAADLQAWVESPPVVVVTPARSPRRRWRWAGVGLLLVLVFGVATAALWPRTEPGIAEPSIAEVVEGGQPVVLVDDAGQIRRPLATADGFEGGIETVPAEKALRLTSGSTLLANFNADGLARPYTVRADVHHSFENLASEVGLVVCQRRHGANEIAAITNTFCGSPPLPANRNRPWPAAAFGGPRWIDLRAPSDPLRDLGQEPKELAVLAHPPTQPGVPPEYRRLVVTVTAADVTVEHDGRLLTRRRWADVENTGRMKFPPENRPAPQPLFGDGVGLLVRNGTALVRNVVIEPAPQQ